MKKTDYTALFSYSMLLVIFIMIAYAFLYQPKHEPTQSPPISESLSDNNLDPDKFKTLVPDAVQIQQISKEPLVLKIVKSDGTFECGAVGKGTGHQSDISVFVTITPEHKITTVTIISAAESPRPFEKLTNSNFLSQFKGKDIYDFNEKAIDTVSGATYSSEGVAKAVADAAKYLNSVK